MQLFLPAENKVVISYHIISFPEFISDQAVRLGSAILGRLCLFAKADTHSTDLSETGKDMLEFFSIKTFVTMYKQTIYSRQKLIKRI